MLFELYFLVLQPSDLSFVDVLETPTHMQSLPLEDSVFTQKNGTSEKQTDVHQIHITIPLPYRTNSITRTVKQG